jgi:hypothetical protein
MRYLVIFLVVCGLAACAPREKLISRGWKIVDVDMGPAKDSAALAFQEMAREQMRTNLLFEMEMDSSYVIRQLKEGTAIRGKWWFSADKKDLFTKNYLAFQQSKVLKLTKKTLVFETKDASGNMVKMICVPK